MLNYQRVLLSNWLVVLTFNHLEKYELVNSWWIIPYVMGNKQMFETTNQLCCCNYREDK
jgi:hypothetical protein